MPKSTPEALRACIAAQIQALQVGLLERATAVRLLLLAALAGEHVLLIGPPGTAKSELARRLHRAFDGARYFERLLTRFSTPEELFGPLSLKALEDDRYERLIEGFLPTAGIAFLDEVFKANSAILNALLTLLNEREFDNGSGRLRTPLISLVGASNEGPADEALQAFHDRFLLRVSVAPVSDAGFADLLRLDSRPARPAAAPFTADQLQDLGDAATQVSLGDDALAACQALRHWLAAQSLTVSDRRWRQWLKLMATAAASEGRAQIDVLDLWLAPYVVSADAADAGRVARWFEADLLGAVPQDAPWLTRAVEAFEQQLQIEEGAEDEGEQSAGKIALARAIGGGSGDEGAGLLRIVSETVEAQTRRRYSPVHIAARLAQIDEVMASAADALAQVQARTAQLQALLQGRLWLPPALPQRWTAAHAQTQATLQGLVDRLQQTRAGYAALPADAQLPAEAPRPLNLNAA